MRRPLNVLYAVVHGDMGGVHRFLDSVFLHHNPERVRPVVLAFRPGSWLQELFARGVPVYCIDGARIRHPIRCFRKIDHVLKAERIDLVHSAYSWVHTLTAPAAAWRGCRQVCFHHGPVNERRWQGLFPLVPADLLLANSRFLLAMLRKTFYCARRTGFIHYGIDAADFSPDESLRTSFRRGWSLDGRTLAVGLVGFIDTWKGQDVLLEAAKRLRPLGLPLRWFIIGGPRDGTSAKRCQEFEQRLHCFARDHNLIDVVHFTGHLDVKKGALDGLDVFVHASTQPEPFGMVILEAMAKAKPVIASDEGGPKEIISHERDGLLIRPRCPDLLARTVQRLLEDADLRERLGLAARHTALTRFHPVRAAGQLESWYERIL